MNTEKQGADKRLIHSKLKKITEKYSTWDLSKAHCKLLQPQKQNALGFKGINRHFTLVRNFLKLNEGLLQNFLGFVRWEGVLSFLLSCTSPKHPLAV